MGLSDLFFNSHSPEREAIARNIDIKEENKNLKRKIEKMEKEQEGGIVLPTAIRKATLVNPRHMVLYGKPKSGKTTAVSKLKNCLIIDVESGAGFVDAMVMTPEKDGKPITGPVGIFNWLKEVSKTIKDAGKPYDYVVIDTLSQLDILAEWVGTYNYMNSTAGKKFNRNDKMEKLKPSDPDYESVLTLGNGYGYRYTRDAIMDIYDTMKDLGKICTIFICHVADKMISNKAGEEVLIKDLALVGKTRDVIPRLCDSIANVWNEDGQMMISFVGDNNKIGGMRAKHLLGFSGILDWDKIFIKE